MTTSTPASVLEAIQWAVRGDHLTRQLSADAMREITEGKATDAQIACLITALRMKGETPDEITGFAMVMREKATPIRCSSPVVIDTCGTGGDASGTFNISTCAAFVTAGAGYKVAKHGNRSITSKSGGADVLLALGVKLDIPPETVERCIEQANMGFLFAPKLHPAMQYAIKARREIGVRTVFNILGPLTNPAGARHQVLGVFNPNLADVMAEVLGSLGSVHAFVVHGLDGLDEISTTGDTHVAELIDGRVKSYMVRPGDFGMRTAALADLRVDSPEQSAGVIREVLAGHPGPARDIVVVNAAAAIASADPHGAIADCIAAAEGSIDSGKAQQALDKLVAITNA
ncbi:MAG TPA: anthranilate phosphoribosyltransferase [Planctomycetota bacterium]|nr:anthranilate phosphoribosyltransferase [Planctomycetota bacterium]